MKKYSKAFTLLELIVVLLILTSFIVVVTSFFQSKPPEQYEQVDEFKRANDLKEQELRIMQEKWQAEQQAKKNEANQ